MEILTRFLIIKDDTALMLLSFERNKSVSFLRAGGNNISGLNH